MLSRYLYQHFQNLLFGYKMEQYNQSLIFSYEIEIVYQFPFVRKTIGSSKVHYGIYYNNS